MMPLYLKKQTGSIQDLRALIGETQNQPTEKHATEISNRKTIYLSVRVNIWRQVSENREEGGEAGVKAWKHSSSWDELWLFYVLQTKSLQLILMFFL